MFKKTYLSRAMTRAWSMEAPIGDPFGGPAFGERNEPVTAFVAAATAFETIAAIGAVVSVVGMVTGNSDLAKIGGVMGLVGGFGTLAQGGMFGEGLKTWTNEINQSWASSTSSNISSAAVPTDAFANGEVVSQSIAGGATAPVDAGSLNLEQLSNASGVTAPTDAGTGLIDVGSSVPADPLAVANGGVTDPLAVNVEGTGGAAAASTPAASTNSALNVASAGEPVNAMAEAASKGGNLAQVKAAGSGINTGTSLFDKISDFANKNKELSKMGLEFIKGAYQSPQDKTLKDAQIASSNSMASLYGAKTAEIQRQMAKANAIPTVTGMRVDPNAQIYKQKPVTTAPVMSTGLIQSR